MFGNPNPPGGEQISTELSDLIGGDFDPSFVTWLFEEVKNHYPEPAAAAAAPTAPAPSIPTGPAAANQAKSSTSTAGLPPRPAGGRSMFGAAVTGVKRDSREMGADGSSREPPQQRQRFDARNGNSNGKSLFDRMGGNNAQFAPGPRNNTPLVNNLGMPQAAFDAITQTIQAVNSGAHPSSLASIPFPALAAHPLSSTLPPQVLAQAQAHAMAQAQAFAQMQNVWNAPAGAFGGAGRGGAGPNAQTGFNPQAAPFNPAGFPAPQQQQGGGFRQGPPHRQHQGAPHARAQPPVVLPKKPELEAICKHGVDCAKPQCGFSHPSPVATKESGLVLSSEACAKQLSCQDADCPKSHVSKAQKNAPSGPASSTSASAAPPTNPTSNAPSGAVVDPSTIPGAGTKPCKFGSACTRPGCVFMHPWDLRGDPNGGTVPCRYGAACTRSDCHFSHPPKSTQTFNRSKFSATFNNPNKSGGGTDSTTTTTKTAAAIGDWPKEKPEHVSERLKRFSTQGNDGEAAEKIIPGQPQAANGREKKVEIHLDDEDEHKEKKEQAKA
ncbi:hypothetical protein JCM3766R1_000257 [Sporobolomyces carnicolor]